MTDIHDTKTEEAVLASILNADDAPFMLGVLGDLMPAPRSQWFHRREHKVFAWALDAAATGQTGADGMAITDWLRTQPRTAVLDHLLGKRPPFGGYSAAQDGDTALEELRGYLPDAIPSNRPAQVRAWAERLRRLGDARAALAATQRLAEAIQTAPLDLAGAVSDSAATLHRLATGGSAELDLGAALGSVLSSDRPHNHSDARWGFTALDDPDTGVAFKRGEIAVLAAPSGGGKTSLALQAASETAGALGTEAVAIASLEMPASTLAAIIAGRLVGVPGRWVQDRDPRIPTTARAALEALAAQWSESKSMLCRDNTVGPDARSLDAILGWIRYRAMASSGRLQLAIIDHMHLIARPARAAATDWIEQCSGQIKACAAALNIPILVLAQMTKEGARATKDSKTGLVTGTPEPVLQDLRGAAALGNDAAQVVFIHDPQAGTDHQDPSRRVRILVRKNRYGACRGYNAIFHAPLQSFAYAPEPRPQVDDDQRQADAARAAEAWTT
jgi:RecA/RadA recombinase